MLNLNVFVNLFFSSYNNAKKNIYIFSLFFNYYIA